MSSSRFSLPLVLVSLVAGVAFGVVWFFVDTKSEDLSDQAAVDSPAGVSMQDDRNRQSGASQVPAGTSDQSANWGEALNAGSESDTNQASADLEAERSLGRDLAQHVKAFFDTPKKTAEGRYLLQPQPVVWSENCKKTPERMVFSDLKDYVATQYTLPDELLPAPQAGTQIMHVNQFYSDQRAKKYFQLSLVQGGDPALGTGYRIERYASRDVYMNEVESNEVLAPQSKRFDLSYTDAVKAFKDIVAEVERQGFKMGTRGLVYGKAVPAGQFSETSIELTGGRISGFTTKGITCDGITEQTLCECSREENPGGDGSE